MLAIALALGCCQEQPAPISESPALLFGNVRVASSTEKPLPDHIAIISLFCSVPQALTKSAKVLGQLLQELGGVLRTCEQPKRVPSPLYGLKFGVVP
jgi:hypothetical protein